MGWVEIPTPFLLIQIEILKMKKITEQYKLAVWTAVSPRRRSNPIDRVGIYDLTKIERKMVCRVVSALREDGYPIASDLHGYYVAECAEDMDRVIMESRTRMKNYVRAYESIVRLREKLLSKEAT